MGGKTVFLYKTWVSKGILRIKDILNAHDNFLSFQDLKDTFDVRGTFYDYGGLLAAIAKENVTYMAIRNAPTKEVTQLTGGMFQQNMLD